MVIVDAHTHIHPDRNGWGQKFDARTETLIAELEQGPVGRAVVLPVAPLVSNEFIAKACAQYPDKLIGFCSVDPLGGRSAMEALEHAVEVLKLRGLKLHPRLQRFGRGDLARVLPLVAKASAYKIPVLIDAFPYGQDLFSAAAIELIHELAVAVPGATLILAHCGGYRLFDALMAAKSNRNIYLDLSFVIPYFRGSSLIERDLGFVIHKLGTERMIYGSDHPEVTVRAAYAEARSVLDGYRLTERQIETICGETITGILAATA